MTTVAEVFDKPYGRVRLGRHGRWWANRTNVALDTYDEITVQFADGKALVEITGTPEQLRRCADALVAQVDGAIANTEREQI